MGAVPNRAAAPVRDPPRRVGYAATVGVGTRRDGIVEGRTSRRTSGGSVSSISQSGGWRSRTAGSADAARTAKAGSAVHSMAAAPLVSPAPNPTTFDLNVRAFVLGAQRAVAMMGDGGRILALSSYGSIRAYPTYANLGAAKAAIEAWVRFMAAEFGPRGITVNAVSGGIIETDSSAFFYRVPGIPPLETVLTRIPRRRMGTAQEMADAATFLLSPQADYITGQVLLVDGGLTVVAPPFHAELGAPLAVEDRPADAAG